MPLKVTYKEPKTPTLRLRDLKPGDVFIFINPDRTAVPRLVLSGHRFVWLDKTEYYMVDNNSSFLDESVLKLDAELVIHTPIQKP